MKILLITFFLFVSATFSVANANCTLGDKTYPTGAIVGTMICGADGYWR